MHLTETYQPTKDFAAEMDATDPLRAFRDQFYIPTKNGTHIAYFCGNSLGLQPKTAEAHIHEVLNSWKTLAVDGHFRGDNPWMTYHEQMAAPLARIVGAQPSEVTVMNTLTVNLHLLMVSFYRPTKQRYKIMIEEGAFPSDQYAVKSQLRFHGFDDKEGLIELKRTAGDILKTEDILQCIDDHKDEIALILLGGINYYTGQVFDMEAITRKGHEAGCVVGLDLAHAAGNVPLNLHAWDVDFAAWCTYKYLNSGPGGISACYVHERYSKRTDIPRFEGWWGHEKATRFLMGPDFVPEAGADGWQTGNLPIMLLASLKASLEIFDRATLPALREKSLRLTGYLEYLLEQIPDERVQVITPKDPAQRGCQLSIRVKGPGKKLFYALEEKGILGDWREPDVIRISPVPLYNSFGDVFYFTETLKEVLTLM
ncbi:MAG: kynureninase [Flavobacteriales bacterium]|nr:kynureninase [Flavobacteriales bacterium]MCB9449349.1 kynureninase [Flavobacteriales bacterium]